MIIALEIGTALSLVAMITVYVSSLPSRSASPFPPRMAAFVTANRISAETPDGHGLFDNLTLAFGRERTALVARNRGGKSTLCGF